MAGRVLILALTVACRGSAPPAPAAVIAAIEQTGNEARLVIVDTATGARRVIGPAIIAPLLWPHLYRPVWTRDGRYLAYVDPSFVVRIVEVRPDTAPVVWSSPAEMWPQCALPDGRIALSDEQCMDCHHGWNLHVVDPATGTATDLGPIQGAAACSVAGSLLWAGDDHTLHVLTADKTRDFAADVSAWTFAWSADERVLAWVGDRGVFSLEFASGTSHQLSTSDTCTSIELVDHDSAVVYTCEARTWTSKLDGSGRREVGAAGSLQLSPDGHELAFAVPAAGPGCAALAVGDVTGSQPRTITCGTFADPAWRPAKR